MPLRTTARITAFSPGQSPPPVSTPIRTDGECSDAGPRNQPREKPCASGWSQGTHTAAQPHQQEDSHDVARRTLLDEVSLADLGPPRSIPVRISYGCQGASLGSKVMLRGTT